MLFGDCFAIARNDVKNQINRAIRKPNSCSLDISFIFYKNENNTALYTGVTNNLEKRILQHRQKTVLSSFTHKYNTGKLVYYEIFPDITSAIKRENQIKAGSRNKKIELILSINKQWKDLFEEISSGASSQ